MAKLKNDDFDAAIAYRNIKSRAIKLGYRDMKHLAGETGFKYITLMNKLRGLSPWLLKEARVISKALNAGIEELFYER